MPTPCSPTTRQVLSTAIPPRRADLYLHNQFLEIKQGRPPNWDNPDIWVFHHDDERAILDPSIDVRIHNRSATAAVNVFISRYLFEFGIGIPSDEPPVTKLITLAGESNLRIPFPREATIDELSPIGVKFTISHPDDISPDDNMGVQVAWAFYIPKSEKMIEVEFPVVNPSSGEHTIKIEWRSNRNQLNVSPEWSSKVFLPRERHPLKITVQVPDDLESVDDTGKTVVINITGTDDTTGSVIGGVAALIYYY